MALKLLPRLPSVNPNDATARLRQSLSAPDGATAIIRSEDVESRLSALGRGSYSADVQFREFSADIKQKGTIRGDGFKLHVGVHKAFAKTLFDGVKLHPLEEDAMRTKFSETRKRGGHIVSIPLDLATRLETERRAFFAAIEKRLAEQADAA